MDRTEPGSEGARATGLSVVVPTLNAAAHLGRLLESLAPARAQGLVTEVVVSDGGSSDETGRVALAGGARFLTGSPARGAQLAAGAEAALGCWLLFLHADTVLEEGWTEAVKTFMARPDGAENAAVFRFAVDDGTPAARRLERMVAWRCRRLGLPYGDQGLLLSRALYDRAGGFRPWPLMEDVDLARRLGRRRIAMLAPAARTSAARYRAQGYLARSARNLVCLALYFLGVPPRLIRKVYG